MSGPQAADHVRSATPVSLPATDRDAHTAGAAPATRAGLRLAVALQAVISAGDGLAMIALAGRVYAGAHASWAVAAVFLAMSVPITVLAPLAGLLLDRLRPQPVLVTAAAGEALVAAAITQVRGVGGILALAVGFGVGAALLQPGLGAMVPQLAGRSGVTRANGYLQAATWGGFTLGPLLAGVLTAAGGTGLALAAVTAAYTAGAIGLWALRLSPPAGGNGSGRQANEPVRAQLAAGLRFLRTDREAGLLVTVVGVMVAFANMAVVAEVILAEGVLHSGPAGYALLVSGWTAGMLAGTLIGGRVPARWLVITTLVTTLATGAGVALAGVALTLWQAVAAYAFGGLADGIETVATRSFLNHRAPAGTAGRVFALYSGVLFGAASLGMAAAGGLLGSLSPRIVLLAAGAGGVVAGAAGWVVHARRARGAGWDEPPRAAAAAGTATGPAARS